MAVIILWALGARHYTRHWDAQDKGLSNLSTPQFPQTLPKNSVSQTPFLKIVIQTTLAEIEKLHFE